MDRGRVGRLEEEKEKFYLKDFQLRDRKRRGR